MTQDEITVMDGGKCILQVRGVRPFFSDKFDITKHPQYKYLSDVDPKNAFDMEKHLRRRPAIVKPVLGPLGQPHRAAGKKFYMAFFTFAVGVLQNLVIALGAGLGIWGVINLMEGYGNDNPGANAQVS